MTKKTHIGRHNTANCARGMSMHMVGRRKPSITVTAEEFQLLPKDQQCQKCVKALARKAADTTSFAKGLSAFLGLK